MHWGIQPVLGWWERLLGVAPHRLLLLPTVWSFCPLPRSFPLPCLSSRTQKVLPREPSGPPSQAQPQGSVVSAPPNLTPASFSILAHWTSNPRLSLIPFPEHLLCADTARGIFTNVSPATLLGCHPHEEEETEAKRGKVGHFSGSHS